MRFAGKKKLGVLENGVLEERVKDRERGKNQKHNTYPLKYGLRIYAYALI